MMGGALLMAAVLLVTTPTTDGADPESNATTSNGTDSTVESRQPETPPPPTPAPPPPVAPPQTVALSLPQLYTTKDCTGASAVLLSEMMKGVPAEVGDVLGFCAKTGVGSSVELQVDAAACALNVRMYQFSATCQGSHVSIPLVPGACVELPSAPNTPGLSVRLPSGTWDSFTAKNAACPFLRFWGKRWEGAVTATKCDGTEATTTSRKAALAACPEQPKCSGACCPVMTQQPGGCNFTETGLYELSAQTCYAGRMFEGRKLFRDSACTQPDSAAAVRSRANGVCVGSVRVTTGADYDALGCAAVAALKPAWKAGPTSGLMPANVYQSLGYMLPGDEAVFPVPRIYENANCAGAGVQLGSAARLLKPVPAELWDNVDKCIDLTEVKCSNSNCPLSAKLKIGGSNSCDLVFEFYVGRSGCPQSPTHQLVLSPNMCTVINAGAWGTFSVLAAHPWSTEEQCRLVGAIRNMRSANWNRTTASYADDAACDAGNGTAAPTTATASVFGQEACSSAGRSTTMTCLKSAVHEVTTDYTSSDCSGLPAVATQRKHTAVDSQCAPTAVGGVSAVQKVTWDDGYSTQWCEVIALMAQKSLSFVSGIVLPQEYAAAGFHQWDGVTPAPPTPVPPVPPTPVPPTPAPVVPEPMLLRVQDSSAGGNFSVTSFEGALGLLFASDSPRVTQVVVMAVCNLSACLSPEGSQCGIRDAQGQPASALEDVGCTVYNNGTDAYAESSAADAGRGASVLQNKPDKWVLADVRPISERESAREAVKADAALGNASVLCEAGMCVADVVNWGYTAEPNWQPLRALSEPEDSEGCSWCLPAALIVSTLIIVCMVFVGLYQGSSTERSHARPTWAGGGDDDDEDEYGDEEDEPPAKKSPKSRTSKSSRSPRKSPRRSRRSDCDDEEMDVR
eukprot:TRINITY_DN1802_c0_g1_i2.p1 TRINITY_DN1802_c0_g1~~TRINITY_DN1802_c0_g1_i2.p1  ORF type:complete len:907 (+),score=158.70 TRINITY_DN1802_c0_g1_i2:669-3389(+)